MSTISAADVNALRKRTNAPMMDCKAALTEAKGDMEKAIDILRQKNSAIQAKKGERAMAEGRIAVYIDPAKRLGAMVEVQCESAPTAKNEMFVQLANDLAKHVALKGGSDPALLLGQPFVDDRFHCSE